MSTAVMTLNGGNGFTTKKTDVMNKTSEIIYMTMPLFILPHDIWPRPIMKKFKNAAKPMFKHLFRLLWISIIIVPHKAVLQQRSSARPK